MTQTNPLPPHGQVDLFGRVMPRHSPTPRPDCTDSIELTEEEIDASDDAAKVAMKLAIEQGRQRATVGGGEMVKVVDGSWAYLHRLPENCFHCKDHNHLKQHHSAVVEAHGESDSPSFADGGYYRIRRDCGRVDVVQRHCLAHA